MLVDVFVVEDVGESVGELWVGVYDGVYCFVDECVDGVFCFGVFGIFGEIFLVGCGGDLEYVVVGVFVGVVDECVDLFSVVVVGFEFGVDGSVVFIEGVRDVFEEYEVEDDVFVLGGVY